MKIGIFGTGAIPPEREKNGVPTTFNIVASSLVHAKDKKMGFQ
jgi:hypothetical protein